MIVVVVAVVVTVTVTVDKTTKTSTSTNEMKGMMKAKAKPNLKVTWETSEWGTNIKYYYQTTISISIVFYQGEDEQDDDARPALVPPAFCVYETSAAT